jgi:hypothetical protein
MLLVPAAIAAYSMSLALVTWVMISEIFPNRTRRGCRWLCAGLSLHPGRLTEDERQNARTDRTGPGWGRGKILLTHRPTARPRVAAGIN